MEDLLGWPAAGVLRIEWSLALRPDGGSEVVCSVAGPLQIAHKEPAGKYFHEAVLKQAGLFGK
jgi:hypothetical protein